MDAPAGENSNPTLDPLQPTPEVPAPKPARDYTRSQNARAARAKRMGKFTKEELYAKRLANAAKGREVIRARKDARQVVEDKVRLNMPITEDERSLLQSFSNQKSEDREAITLAAASKLLLRPTHVTELRALVEKVANKHSYNPLEELILLTKPVKVEGMDKMQYQCTAEKRIDIHKALLPFLTPQLRVAPAKEDDGQEKGVKVTITQFVFPEDKKDAKKIHEAPVTVVATTPDTPPTS